MCDGVSGQRRDASANLMYYGARYYDSALGRFISADTVVGTPLNPQELNRYTYGLNNPLRYKDPSGHCVQVHDQDEECWALYAQALRGFEGRPVGLEAWDSEQLRSLVALLSQGIRFTSHDEFRNGVIWAVGGSWNAQDVRAVISGLGRVSAFLHGDLKIAQGVTFNKWIGRIGSGAGGETRAPEKVINLFLPNDLNAEQGAETVIHEMGHLVDWYAGGNCCITGTGRYWTDLFLTWEVSARDRGGAVSRYASGALNGYSKKEDFAETFVWTVENSFKVGGYDFPVGGQNAARPDDPRLDALGIALSKIP